MVFLLVGLMFTLRTGFFQVTRFKLWFSKTFLACIKNKSVRKTDDKTSISQFQSLCTSLAATLGTGNIAGVATAIVAGGPGAVFWMWISAFLGMMTNFAENVLGIKYRYKNEKNEWCGGAMIYMERGLGWKWMAIIYSAFCLLASFGIGNMTQANSIANGLSDSFGIPALTTGIVIAVLVALVIMGGIKRIASVTEKFVPIMSIAYLIGSMIIIICHAENISDSFYLIFTEAFRLKSAFGGIAGYTIMKAMGTGVSRGVFSNEAGLGSSVIVNSASDVKEPVQQGMWGIFQVFADTIVVCTITAVVILCSGVYNKDTFQLYYNKEIDGKTIADTVIDIKENTIQKLENVKPNANTEIEITAIIYNAINEVILKTDLYEDDARIIIGNAKDTFISLGDSGKKRAEQLDVKDLDYVHNSIDNLVTSSLEQVDDIPIKDGVSLTILAFESVFGSFGSKFVSIAVVFFAFSTLIGWSYYGQRAIEYLIGPKFVPLYKIIFSLIIIIGATLSLNLVWDVSDTFNGLMAIPNLIAITLLSGTVIKITKNYFAGKEFDPNED